MKAFNILGFIAATFILLAILCTAFPRDGVSFASHTFRFPSISEVMKGSKTSAETAEERIREIENSLKLSIDSTLLADSLKRADTLQLYHKFFCENPARIICPNNDYTFFNEVFASFDNAKKESVYIMHYGDSQIEGDRITGYLRNKLHEKFGGSGPGLVPAIQLIPSASIQQICSDTLQSFFASGMMGRRASHNRYGALAQVVNTYNNTDTVNFAFTSRNSRNFRHITLFAGQIDSSLNATLQTNSAHIGSRKIEKCNSTQSVSWSLNQPLQSLNINICGIAEIYGFAIDGGSGVSICNVPLRGSDGTFFSRMNVNGLSTMLNKLNTRLIILEFGGNALPEIKDTADVNRFEKAFAQQIKFMTNICPKAKIMVIGPADMSVKVNGELQTHPMLKQTIAAMQKAAVNNNAAFWNMYEVMGGYNSMIAWVDNKPAWAATDYIHFTVKGANRIAEILWESMMKYYEYKSLQDN